MKLKSKCEPNCTKSLENYWKTATKISKQNRQRKP